jgi:rod shape-determining protein MreC
MRRKEEDRIFFAGVLVVLILVMISIGSHRYFKDFFGLNRDAYYWIEKVSFAPFGFASHVWDNYLDLVNTKQENSQLKQNLEKARVEISLYKELANENERLKAMLEFKGASNEFKLLSAMILSQDVSIISKTMVIDKGTRDGFRKSMPVINADGVIGRVIETSPDTAQVLLITDPNSAIPALIEDTRIKGIVKGKGDGSLSLEYVRDPEGLNIGSPVVTSGLLGVFPKGLKLGYIKEIRRPKNKIFLEITLKPSVKIEKIEEVFGVESYVSGN